MASSSTTAIPMFGYSIRHHDLSVYGYLREEEELCILIHQNPGGYQTDGLGILGSSWYNPRSYQQQQQQQASSSSKSTCGPPIPIGKHVNIKVYGTYDNIKKRNYAQLRHTLNYVYDENDVHTNQNACNIAFQSSQQFAQHYNECKTHPITSQFMSLHPSYWNQSSTYSYDIQLGIVTSIDHTNNYKPITLQQLTINNNNNNNNNTNPAPTTKTSQDIPKFINNITFGNIITLKKANDTYYTPPCVGWLCLIVGSNNRYSLSYSLLNLVSGFSVNNTNNINNSDSNNNGNTMAPHISQFSPKQQQALYEIVHHWENVEKNKKQYTYRPIPHYDDINPYDYINVVRQARLSYTKHIAEEIKRIEEEQKIQKQKQEEYANNIRNERLALKPMILQSFSSLLDEQVIDRFIEDEYQTNCLLSSSVSSSKEEQEDTSIYTSIYNNNNSWNIIESLFTLPSDILSNINSIAIHDYILYLKQTIQHMKCSLTNELSSFPALTKPEIFEFQQHSQNNVNNNPNMNNHNNNNNNNNSQLIQNQHYKYQSYLRREYNIKYRSQCTSISQTTIDCILNDNALYIEPSTDDDNNNNHYASSNIMPTSSQTSYSIGQYTTLLSYQLALATTYATMRNNQLHFILAQHDSKQNDYKEEEQDRKQQQQQQEQSTVVYDDIDKENPPLSQHYGHHQQSEVEFLRDQLKTKDQQLQYRDQQLKAKDQQSQFKDVQLQDFQQQLGRKDVQIAMLLKLLEQSKSCNTHNNNNNIKHYTNINTNGNITAIPTAVGDNITSDNKGKAIMPLTTTTSTITSSSSSSERTKYNDGTYTNSNDLRNIIIIILILMILIIILI